MNLRWGTGYLLKNGDFEYLLPDRQSAQNLALDLMVADPEIVRVDVIVDDNNGIQRAWLIEEFSGPFEFAKYECESDESKKKRALAKLTSEEKKLLGIK